MLEHKRLSDLVFVHYNMRLKHSEYYNRKKGIITGKKIPMTRLIMHRLVLLLNG
ncbi:hypothetical protein LINPERHAP1_LOCUS24492 [Linum perenne]